MDAVLNLYKRRSETPLQTIERYVAAHREYAGAKMTYAGRLDPMAEGVLVVLAGEANKRREEYIGLDKEYEFEFMLGVETDTHDLLGKVVAADGSGAVDEAVVRSALEKYRGTFEQEYPAYSSKVVDGKSLIDHAREGRDVVLPRHNVTVSRIELVGSRMVARDEFFARLREDVGAVRGDFRQREILELWSEYEKSAPSALTVYKARLSCGSGFYVRRLVSDVGRDIGTGAVTVSILRTRAGEYTLADSARA